MKTKHSEPSHLIEEGRDRLENTNEFQCKVDAIRKNVREKYALNLVNEKNWAKRLVMVIRREIEIRRRVTKLSSLENLHLQHPWQM